MSDRKDVITAIEDFNYRENLEKIENINLLGRNIVYVEAITEFLEQYPKIKIILISENFFNDNKIEIEKVADKYQEIAFYILYDKKIKVESEIKENMCFYERNEFLYNYGQQKEKEKECMENAIELNDFTGNLSNNELVNSLSTTNKNNLVEKQNSFLETSFGKIINTAMDIGIKAALPDLIEDEVINVKNVIFESGLQAGLKSVIDSSLNLGKSAIGIFTGEFENISQIQTAVKSGGLIDGISNLLDYSIKFAKNKGLINTSTANLLKQGKNTVLKTVTSKIEEELTTQIKSSEKLQEYCTKWQENYEKQNFSGMESNFKNIEKYLNKITPLENTINQARKIENLHNLIKNNGMNFNISENEKILAEKLAI